MSTKLVNGKRVKLSVSEQTEFDANEAIYNSLVEQKTRRIDHLRVVTKEKRDAGVTVNGLHVATDADGRSLIIGARQGGKPSRKIVTKTGRAILTKIQVEELATAVDDYLQSVFDNQYDLEEAIEAAADQTALDAIDINAGWPA